MHIGAFNSAFAVDPKIAPPKDDAGPSVDRAGWCGEGGTATKAKMSDGAAAKDAR